MKKNYQKKRRQTSQSEVSAAKAAAAASVADVMADRREGLTNPIESMISICRDSTGNVKRWRNGQMALRCCAAGMLKAEKQFRRVNGHLHLAALRQPLDVKTEGRHGQPRYLPLGRDLRQPLLRDRMGADRSLRPRRRRRRAADPPGRPRAGPGVGVPHRRASGDLGRREPGHRARRDAGVVLGAGLLRRDAERILVARPLDSGCRDHPDRLPLELRRRRGAVHGLGRGAYPAQSDIRHS